MLEDSVKVVDVILSSLDPIPKIFAPVSGAALSSDDEVDIL